VRFTMVRRVNEREQPKNCKCAAIMIVFAKIAMWFKLSAPSHSAYCARVGHGPVSGTGSSLTFLIPRNDVMLKVL